jgi:1-acyl-sn-glycerol-3-phosphate acyltransferase
MRTLIALPFTVALTLVLAGWISFRSVIRIPVGEKQCERIGRFWSRWVLRVSGAKVRIEGLDRIDWTRPHILVANHQSWYDVWVLAGCLPASVRFVAKQELARIPIFGRAWQACGHISVDRADRGRAIRSLDHAGRRVQHEALTVVLFPEGTRSADGRLQSFKKGAFVLALQTGVPLVPVGISGSRHVMGKGSFRVRGGEIRVRVGTPIAVEGLTTRDREGLLRRARREILDLMEDADAAPGRPVEPSDDREGNGTEDEDPDREEDEERNGRTDPDGRGARERNGRTGPDGTEGRERDEDGDREARGQGERRTERR